MHKVNRLREQSCSIRRIYSELIFNKNYAFIKQIQHRAHTRFGFYVAQPEYRGRRSISCHDQLHQIVQTCVKVSAAFRYILHRLKVRITETYKILRKYVIFQHDAYGKLITLYSILYL